LHSLQQRASEATVLAKRTINGVDSTYALPLFDCSLMSQYRLLKHKDYERSAESLSPSIRRKALWAQVLLGTRGRTPSVKGTTGLNAHWRRTPVQGNHYYMWWIPNSESGIDRTRETGEQRQEQTILVHSIRHHDETDEPIDPGSLTDYEEIPIATLDPRYEEQTDISYKVQQEYISLAAVKGLPGSGKTISLLYLARDLAQRDDLNKILYITYTSRLKRAAQEFLQAQGSALAQKVRVATLSEIEAQLTRLPTHHEPFGELPRFIDFLNLQNNTVLGPWRRYPQTLFTEIRAQLLGKLFPPGYQLPSQRAQELATFQTGLDANAYASSRKLDVEAAELACRLAERAQKDFFFQDQQAAYQAIQRLQRGRGPGWVTDLDALIIDEVQDLTLVQIAMLGELVSDRLRRRDDASFAFVIAGDESQIVQPSGFDWGVTKDLLGEQVGTWPDEFEFSYQRRSPHNLAKLIDNSWNFYVNLPRRLRPSGRGEAFLYEAVGDDATDEGNGQLFLCPPVDLPSRAIRQGAVFSTAGEEEDGWQQLLDELVAKPGRVIVDLSEGLQHALRPYLTTAEESEEAIFLPRDIKGLERTTVILYGLNSLFERAIDLCHNHHRAAIPLFEARRIFDEMRVALSRSTNRLVILEAADAPVLAALEIQEIPGVLPIRWQDLVETLQTEELSMLEVIEGYLDEVDDFFERGMWTQGYRRNRRAYDLAVQLEDFALKREAEEQHITGHLQEARQLMERQEWQRSRQLIQRATTLADSFGDLILIEDVDDQATALSAALAIEVEQLLEEAAQRLAAKQFQQSHERVEAAGTLAKLANDPALSEQVDEAFAAVAWRWAARLLDQDKSPATMERVVQLFERAAQAMQQQEDDEGVQALHILAERYRQLPPKAHFAKQEIVSLLERTERYLALVGPLALEEEAYLYVKHWLDESFAALQQHTDLYYSWVTLAQEFVEVAPYPTFDEHLWELENQLGLLIERGRQSPDDPVVKRFRAFSAAYNETPAEASLLWEELGETELASTAARTAGDLERAYQLIRQAKAPMPEDLAVTVKAVRLLQQLQQKHHALYPAERQALLDLLQEVGAEVAADPLLRDDERW